MFPKDVLLAQSSSSSVSWTLKHFTIFKSHLKTYQECFHPGCHSTGNVFVIIHFPTFQTFFYTLNFLPTWCVCAIEDKGASTSSPLLHLGPWAEASVILLLLVNQGVSSTAKIVITNVLCINVCHSGTLNQHFWPKARCGQDTFYRDGDIRPHSCRIYSPRTAWLAWSWIRLFRAASFQTNPCNYLKHVYTTFMVFMIGCTCAKSY